MAAKLDNTTELRLVRLSYVDDGANTAAEVPDGVSPLYLTGDAAEGISCEFCHKIADVILDEETQLPLADMPGIMSLKLLRPVEGEEIFFGTFDDIPRRDTYLPLQEESAFCAGCHYGVFGGVVGMGQVTGGTLIYNSYGEWLESPYSDPETGQTCQDCHMPVIDEEYFVYPDMGGMPRPGQIHTHLMPGASDEELLRNSATMTATAVITDGQLVVDVAVIERQDRTPSADGCADARGAARRGRHGCGGRAAGPGGGPDAAGVGGRRMQAAQARSSRSCCRTNGPARCPQAPTGDR